MESTFYVREFAEYSIGVYYDDLYIVISLYIRGLWLEWWYEYMYII